MTKFGHLSNVHFADTFRVWYCLQFGGTWIDADCLHLRPFGIDQAIDEGKAAICWADHACCQVTNHLIHAPKPGLEFLRAWFDRCEGLVRDKGPAGLEYLDLGEWSIDHLRAHHGGDRLLQMLPHWEYHYVPWYHKHYFGQHRDWGEFQFDRGLFNPNAYCYHLTNAVIATVGHLSREDLLRSRSFVGFLTRRALQDGEDGSKCSAILGRLPEIHRAYQYVEVGVYKGYNVAIIGQQRSRAIVHAIDPWMCTDSQAYRETADYIAFDSNATHEDNFREAHAHCWFLNSQDRIRWHRSRAMDAVGQFADGSVDMVFLDGDHSESAVAQEIDAYWPKVAAGGWLGGHDYEHPGFYSGVKAAVDRFVTSIGLSLELDCDYSWFVKKPAP